MSMEGDITGRDEDRALVAEYVLGLLDAAEHTRVALRIAAEPELAAEQRLWERRFSGLDGEFAETAVPAHLLARIESRLFGAPQAERGFWVDIWNNLTVWRGLAVAGLAIAVVATGINLMQPRIDVSDIANQLVAALEEEGSGVKFVAFYDGTSGKVRLTALSGAAVPDKDFELWAIQGDQAPVSMGVVPIDTRTQVPLQPDVLAKFGEGSVLAITLEQKGGSPDGTPHGPIVAKGVATPI